MSHLLLEERPPDNHALDVKGLSLKGFFTKSVFFELFNQSISRYKL